MYATASTEPLDVIERAECFENYTATDITASRFQACFNEIERLRAALTEIATGKYSSESFNGTGHRPGMIWEIAARRALSRDEQASGT